MPTTLYYRERLLAGQLDIEPRGGGRRLAPGSTAVTYVTPVARKTPLQGSGDMGTELSELAGQGLSCATCRVALIIRISLHLTVDRGANSPAKAARGQEL